jgi:hypothetical protein
MGIEGYAMSDSLFENVWFEQLIPIREAKFLKTNIVKLLHIGEGTFSLSLLEDHDVFVSFKAVFSLVNFKSIVPEPMLYLPHDEEASPLFYNLALLFEISLIENIE